MNIDLDLALEIKKILSASPSSHYEIAELTKSTSQEAEKALRYLAEGGEARKTGSGSWVDSEPKDDEVEQDEKNQKITRRKA